MTFTREGPGTYDPVTDSWTDTADVVVTGEAILVRGDPQRYVANGLNLATMPTVLFTPNAYPLRAWTPEFVMPGDVTELNGIPMVAKDIDPVAPDGNVIIARIALAGAGA